MREREKSTTGLRCWKSQSYNEEKRVGKKGEKNEDNNIRLREQ